MNCGAVSPGLSSVIGTFDAARSPAGATVPVAAAVAVVVWVIVTGDSLAVVPVRLPW